MSDAPKLVRRVAAVLVVALAALLLVASADAKPKKAKFVSKRYHYSLLLPGGSGRWIRDHATGNWSGNYPPSFQNSEFDRLIDQLTQHAWFVAAKRVPKGMTLKRWTAYTIAKRNPSSRPLRWRSNATLGGAPARRYDLSGPEGRVIVMTALHADRGYLFICVPGIPLKRVAAQRVCSPMQRSFRYTGG